MEIDILLRKEIGIFVFNIMEMGWEFEYGHGNGRENEIDKSFLHISTAEHSVYLNHIIINVFL